MKTFFALALLFWILSMSAAAQTTREVVSLAGTERLTLRSDKIGHRYELLVSLPAGYAASGKRYPVLYVLDGWHFPLLAFLQDNASSSKRMPPVIIVNISHGDGDAKKRSDMRFRDFTPTTAKEFPASGHADDFLSFLENEVIPLVDRTYRTDTGDRALLGHSLGGIFALYALQKRPELFGRIVAASPVVDFDNRVMFKGVDGLKLKKTVRLDVSVARDEGRGWTETAIEYGAALDKAKIAHLTHRFQVYEGENHSSVRLRSFPDGLYWVYKDLLEPAASK